MLRDLRNHYPEHRSTGAGRARVFEAIAELKQDIDERELRRIRDRAALRRRKTAESTAATARCLVDRSVEGLSVHDVDLATVTREEVLSAARKYLPSHGGAYVRLALLGE